MPNSNGTRNDGGAFWTNDTWSRWAQDELLRAAENRREREEIRARANALRSAAQNPRPVREAVREFAMDLRQAQRQADVQWVTVDSFSSSVGPPPAPAEPIVEHKPYRPLAAVAAKEKELV